MGLVSLFHSFFSFWSPADLPLSKAETSSNSKPSLHSSIQLLPTATTIGPTACRLPTLLFSLLTLASVLLCSSVFLRTGPDCDCHSSNCLPTAALLSSLPTLALARSVLPSSFRQEEEALQRKKQQGKEERAKQIKLLGKNKSRPKMPVTLGNVRSILAESFKTYTADDVEITNYNEKTSVQRTSTNSIFKKYCDSLNPNFKLVSRYTIRAEVMLVHKEEKIKLYESLDVMASPMKQKFEKYREESCLVLGIAVVLDPKFKMNLVEFYYDAIYGSDAYRYVERVKTAF
ncbi:hypothetical protein M9H77_27348 [Catharanthus roseus]|uniref:Uncharacterized protein n=1 Tax=Catharanthus roseus TaxID=4058 RepID=A0ACC0ACF7_CATRO|nr:hypothetical protein M9H77_27348 [Catharanthus roseus]